MEGQADVKEELTEEDCSYEYRGAPSPEAPVYKLIPLQTISASSLKIKQEINSIVENNNYLFNKGELEKRYTFLKKMMPNCQNDVPVQSCDSNIGTVNFVQDKATQCTDDYVALNFRFMKDAWTETSTELENFCYENNNGGMCTCNKSSERPNKVEVTDDVLVHESDFSLSQDSPLKN